MYFLNFFCEKFIFFRVFFGYLSQYPYFSTFLRGFFPNAASPPAAALTVEGKTRLRRRAPERGVKTFHRNDSNAERVAAFYRKFSIAAKNMENLM